MSVFTVSQVERNEVESILQSGLFDKATRLERFFRYVCEQYFAGRGELIKEYSIALEALGRPTTFDPKKDSIVRVEAHRLRKRLEQYYQTDGATHAVRVLIPNGQYRPTFVVRNAPSEVSPPSQEPEALASAPPESAEIEPVSIEFQAAAPVKTIRKWNIYLIAAAIAAVLLVLYVLATHTLTSKPSRPKAAVASAPVNEVWTGRPSEPAGAEMRILTGYHGAPFIDRQGHTWNSDAYYRGGLSSAIAPNSLIEGGPDPRLVKGRRAGGFSYDIPLRPGTYELHLYFAETEFGKGNPGGGGDSTRIFKIWINEAARLDGFDPLGEAGAPNRLIDRVIPDVVPAADGKLHLKFEPGNEAAFLNAIELLPSAPGRIRPIRIVAQSEPVTDSDGRLWAADEYFSGGIGVERQNAVANPSDRALYQGERFGNFCYRIPVAPGKYRVTLHFAETFFGTFAFQEDPINRRLFNVFANGTALLRDFDVAKQAGGPNREIKRVFDNVVPNAQGMILLEFMPVKNYAEINAIEVVGTE